VITVIAATAMLLASPLLADPFRKEQVSAKAKWLVHADVKAFLASKTGAFVLEELKKKGLKAVLDNIQEAFALDVTKDLKSVTLYGSRFGDHAAVILIRATMDRDRVTEMLKGNPTYRELKYAGHTVHQWTDNPESDRPGPTKFGIFHGDDLAIMAEDLPLIQEAIDVLDKKAASLGTRGAARSVPAASKDTFLTAFLTELPPIGEGKPEGIILRKIASGSLEAGESKGRLRAQVALMAKTAKTAGDLRKVAEGVLAFIDLASPGQAGETPAPSADQVVFQGTTIPAELIAVLKGVTVTVQGRTVKAAADVPVDSAIALLRKVIDPEGAGDAE